MPARRKAGYRRATTTESDVKNDVTCPLRPASRIGTSLRRLVDNEAAPSRCRCSVAAQRSARPLQAGVDNARTERRPRPLPRLSAWGSQRHAACRQVTRVGPPGDLGTPVLPPRHPRPHVRRRTRGGPRPRPGVLRGRPADLAPFHRPSGRLSPLRPKTPPATSASRHQGVDREAPTATTTPRQPQGRQTQVHPLARQTITPPSLEWALRTGLDDRWCPQPRADRGSEALSSAWDFGAPSATGRRVGQWNVPRGRRMPNSQLGWASSQSRRQAVSIWKCFENRY